MKVVFCSLIVMFLFSCGQDKTKNSNHNKEVKSYVEKEQSSSTESTVEMLFLGHYIRCLRQDLPLEFARICREDNSLSYDSINQNVTIYGTTFHLNYLQSNHGFFLLTSVQPDTKQIQKVREACGRKFYMPPQIHSSLLDRQALAFSWHVEAQEYWSG